MKLSDKLKEKGMLFAAIPVLLLITLFLPIVHLDLGGEAFNTSLWQMLTNNMDNIADNVDAKHWGNFISAPLFLIIGLLLTSLTGIYFMVANKKGYDSAKPLMIIGLVGSLILVAFILFLFKSAVAESFFNNFTDGNDALPGFKEEFIKELKEGMKVAWGAWVMILVAVTGAGLSLSAFLDDKK